MLALGKRIKEAADIEKPDIIHAHSPILNAIPALIIGRILKIPVVYEIRAFWEDAGVDQGTYVQDSLKYNIVKNIETFVCRHADQVCVLCNELKKDLIKRGISPEKMTPVFNGINIEDFTICAPDAEFLKKWGLEGKKIIGFIGSFYRYEGLDILVQAFSRLLNKHSDIMLLLVGGGEMEQEIREMVKNLEIEKHVVMPGRISHKRIPGVYALTDILAYPRHSVRLTELVTPLKPLEAMAMGKVVAASNVGGHRELIVNGKNGILFKADNAFALVEAFDNLLTNPELCQELRKNSPKWVKEEHNWEKTLAVYLKIYEQSLNIQKS